MAIVKQILPDGTKYTWHNVGAICQWEDFSISLHFDNGTIETYPARIGESFEIRGRCQITFQATGPCTTHAPAPQTAPKEPGSGTYPSDSPIKADEVSSAKEPEKLTEIKYLIANDCIWFSSVKVKWLIDEITALEQKLKERVDQYPVGCPTCPYMAEWQQKVKDLEARENDRRMSNEFCDGCDLKHEECICRETINRLEAEIKKKVR